MRKAFNVSLQPEDYDRLIKICEEHGLVWGARPSISVLLKAIAQGDFNLNPTKKARRRAWDIM